MDVKIVENPVIETIFNLLEDSTTNKDNTEEKSTTPIPSMEPSSEYLENSTTTLQDNISVTTMTTTTTTKEPTTDKKVHQLKSTQNTITINKILILIIFFKPIYFS